MCTRTQQQLPREVETALHQNSHVRCHTAAQCVAGRNANDPPATPCSKSQLPQPYHNRAGTLDHGGEQVTRQAIALTTHTQFTSSKHYVTTVLHNIPSPLATAPVCTVVAQLPANVPMPSLQPWEQACCGRVHVIRGYIKASTSREAHGQKWAGLTHSAPNVSHKTATLHEQYQASTSMVHQNANIQHNSLSPSV